jgi:hypothetical protein
MLNISLLKLIATLLACCPTLLQKSVSLFFRSLQSQSKHTDGQIEDGRYSPLPIVTYSVVYSCFNINIENNVTFG